MSSAQSKGLSAEVLAAAQANMVAIEALLQKYHLKVATVAGDATVPGSFWGDSEAGLIGNVLYVRDDTPVHSLLHEACHYICMDSGRRQGLHTDAGGGYQEESGVCYLQILLAGLLPGVGRDRLMRDMDTWGYSFRLGSARAWFESDAEDARQWLLDCGLIDAEQRPTWNLRS